MFRRGSIYLHEVVGEAREKGKTIPVYPKVLSALKKNKVHGLLERVKLHTDPSQINLVDLHAACYLYVDGGNPPDIFTTGFIQRVEHP